MLILEHGFTDIATPSGLMRTHVFRPFGPGKFPGIVLFSEIFQLTESLRRSAAMLSGHGYVVACPEIFHEFEPAGEVLPYDDAAILRGCHHKAAKSADDHDRDISAVLGYLKSLDCCSGRLGAMGFCIGGHLAFRAAMTGDVDATACVYPTDLCPKSPGQGMPSDSLARSGDIQGEILILLGRQDPHIPAQDRALIRQSLEHGEVHFSWHEFEAQHAFMRDVGPRYDPALALSCWGLILDMFKRRLSDA